MKGCESIVTFEEFEEMAYEIVETLPEEFFRELNGGVIVKDYHKVHPESVGEELSIMGEYCRNHHLGRYVVIYYGSFMKVYGCCSEEVLKIRLRKTILHEFRHHLESLAGERDLEIEDEIGLIRYQEQKKTLSSSFENVP